MSKSSSSSSPNCANCERYSTAVEEQKSKLNLLETRLKDVLRAYKLLAREKENLQAINASITADVDSTQQRRIADLEETVLQLSTLCGKVELERKADRETISRLEAESDKLRFQLSSRGNETTTTTTGDSLSSNVPPVDVIKPRKEVRNKACQTVEVSVEKMPEKKFDLLKRSEDKSCQTKEVYHELSSSSFASDQPTSSSNSNNRLRSTKSYETAIVSPFNQRGRSVSETVVEEDVNVHEDEEEDDDDDDSRSQTEAHETNNSDDHLTASSAAAAAPEGSTSLFYVNELARRELELVEYK